MNKNKSDNNTEAIKIANALKPFVKNWFDEWGQSCVRSKKMTVTTAPNGSVIGVKDAFSETEIFIKYMSSCSNAVVGDTVWVKWMYDNMQTLFADRIGNFDRDNYVPVSGGTFTGDVTFNGVVDVVNRRCDALLSSVGWYRILTYNAYDQYSAIGTSGEIVDFNIVYTANVNCGHSIRLMLQTNAIKFCDETSNGNANIIDKIRYTVNGNKGYVDIHFNYSSGLYVHVDFNVHSRQYAMEKFVSSNLQSVADAPSGETVMTTYSFEANGFVPNQFILTTYGDLSQTGESQYPTPSAVSVPDSTHTDVASVTLGAGIWLMATKIRFAKNGTGYRYQRLSTTAGSSGSNFSLIMNDTAPALADDTTYTQGVDLIVAATEKTYYLKAWQNSGGNLSCTGRIAAIRIC